MNEENRRLPFPVIFAAPSGQESYFAELDQFIRDTLGDEATRFYQVIVGEPDKVAREARRGVERVQRYRRKTQEAYYFNWQLMIDAALQRPFVPTHENMAALRLDRSLPPAELAAELRCAFSGIVAGNVKAYGIQQIAERGPYRLRGDAGLTASLDKLLQSFVAQRRMKLGSGDYRPCYEIER